MGKEVQRSREASLGVGFTQSCMVKLQTSLNSRNEFIVICQVHLWNWVADYLCSMSLKWGRGRQYRA